MKNNSHCKTSDKHRNSSTGARCTFSKSFSDSTRTHVEPYYKSGKPTFTHYSDRPAYGFHDVLSEYAIDSNWGKDSDDPSFCRSSHSKKGKKKWIYLHYHLLHKLIQIFSNLFSWFYPFLLVFHFFFTLLIMTTFLSDMIQRNCRGVLAIYDELWILLNTLNLRFAAYRKRTY